MRSLILILSMLITGPAFSAPNSVACRNFSGLTKMLNAGQQYISKGRKWGPKRSERYYTRLINRLEKDLAMPFPQARRDALRLMEQYGMPTQQIRKQAGLHAGPVSLRLRNTFNKIISKDTKTTTPIAKRLTPEESRQYLGQKRTIKNPQGGEITFRITGSVANELVKEPSVYDEIARIVQKPIAAAAKKDSGVKKLKGYQNFYELKTNTSRRLYGCIGNSGTLSLSVYAKDKKKNDAAWAHRILCTRNSALTCCK